MFISSDCIIFAIESITNELHCMATSVVRKATSFRLRADLLEGLKRNAARENRTLNNYVESVLLDIVYNEPNEVTKTAIEEAVNRKDYPKEELYSSANDLFNTLNEETGKE